MEYSIMLGEKGEGGYGWDIHIGKEGGSGKMFRAGTGPFARYKRRTTPCLWKVPVCAKSLCWWEAAAWELDGSGVMLPEPHTALLSPGFQGRLVGRGRLSPPPKQGSVLEDSSTYSFLLSWFCLQLKLFCGFPHPPAKF